MKIQEAGGAAQIVSHPPNSSAHIKYVQSGMAAQSSVLLSMGILYNDRKHFDMELILRDCIYPQS